MIIRKGIRPLLAVLLSAIAFAQSSPGTNPLMGDIRPISFRGGGETNVVFGTLAASAAVDDDINDSFLHPIGGAQYSLAPYVEIQETHPHLIWDLAYHPLLRFFVPQIEQPDLFSQAFNGTLQYNFTKRLSVGLRQDFLRTTDPFQQLGEGGIGLLNQPGTVDLGAFRRTQLLSQAELDYRSSKHTTVGVDGSFLDNNYQTPFGDKNSLIDSRDTLGSAFISHQFTPKNSFGVQYQFLDILFPGQHSHTITNGLLLFDQVAFSQHTTLLVFGGPERSAIHNNTYENLDGFIFTIPESSILWSPGVGAMLSWRGERTGFQGSYVQRVSDGGGLLGAVEMKNGMIRMSQRLARRWVADLNGEVTDRTLLAASGVGKLEALDLGAGVGHELSHQFWIRVLYQRKHDIGGHLTTLQFGNHNRFTLSVERDFNLPLGR